MKMIDFLDKGAAISPHGVCLHDDQHSYTYREVVGWTNRVVRALREDGIGAGQRVAICSPNDVEAFITVLSLHRADCVWIVMNARNSLSDNIALLNKYQAEWLFYHSDIDAQLPDIVTLLRASVVFHIVIVFWDAKLRRKRSAT